MKPRFRGVPGQRQLAALVMSCLALLPGCGPGVGGTGTGQVAAELGVFGATAASVCDSSLASGLECVSVGTVNLLGSDGVTVITLPAGTAALSYVDATLGARRTLQFEDHKAQLRSSCEPLDFIGDWGVTTPTESRFFGSLLLPGASQRVPASLSVQPDAAQPSSRLLATLRDAQGRVLLGPMTLLRQPVAALPTGACPA